MLDANETNRSAYRHPYRIAVRSYGRAADMGVVDVLFVARLHEAYARAKTYTARERIGSLMLQVDLWS